MNQVRYEKRFMAYLIDIAISLGIAMATTTVHTIVNPLGFIGYFTSITILSAIVFFIYSVIFYILFGGLTIGRMIFNIRVVNSDYSRMKITTIIMRCMLQSLFFLALYNIGYMLVNRTQTSFYEVATDTVNVAWHN